MTNEEREKHLDWLYRLKREIFVFMPIDWLIPFADALDVAIKALEQEPTTKNDVPENNAENIYICSCGYGWDKSKVVRYHFCPNCGKAVASATKNDLGVDCISRAYLYNRIKKIDHDEDYECDEFGGSRITYHTCDWDEVLREIEDAPPVTPQEPFINKPCVSEKVCKHDENKVLDKIRAEIESITPKAHIRTGKLSIDTELMIPLDRVLKVLDKYKAEIEPQEREG